jgi:pyrroloquinoline quinone (PQQ) biosynthesis protein C
MEQISDTTRPVTTPDEAIEQFVGEQYIEWLMEYAVATMRAWPEIAAIGKVTPKIEKVRKFILQRFIAAEAFAGGREGEPGFLGFAIANLSESDDPQAESALSILEKKQQEEFEGQTSKVAVGKNRHKELWTKLLKALGASDEEISRAEAKEWTRNYIAELSDLYSNGEWQEVAGAFATHERLVPEEYAAIIAMLRAHTQVSDAEMEVLIWHSGVDAKYVATTNHVLEKIVFDPESKRLVWQGAVRELQTRKEFLAGLIKHLEA